MENPGAKHVQIITPVKATNILMNPILPGFILNIKKPKTKDIQGMVAIKTELIEAEV
ncbi:hypothetical protein HMPREF0378_1623 [Eubacterium nodatum ATCC 33099]|nr:hypothetical protein HMPREF0378_1623 [Eubacterium nodatum ATCC 33099]